MRDFVTDKERAKVKKSIKITLDKADHMIDLATIGVMVGACENSEESASTRATIVKDLEELKVKLAADVEIYMQEIDKSIKAMS